jgi:hypothetical protein
MTLDSRRESDYPLSAKSTARERLRPEPFSDKLASDNRIRDFCSSGGVLWVWRSTAWLPPDLRLSTPSTLLPVAPLLMVIKTHPAIARATRRAGSVQCAYVQECEG